MTSRHFSIAKLPEQFTFALRSKCAYTYRLEADATRLFNSNAHGLFKSETQ